MKATFLPSSVLLLLTALASVSMTTCIALADGPTLAQRLATDEATVAAEKQQIATDQKQAGSDYELIANHDFGVSPLTPDDVYKQHIYNYMSDQLRILGDQNTLAIEENSVVVDQISLGITVHQAPLPASNINTISVPNGPISASEKQVLMSRLASQRTKLLAALSAIQSSYNSEMQAWQNSYAKIVMDRGDGQEEAFVSFQNDLPAAIAADKSLFLTRKTYSSIDVNLIYNSSNIDKLNKILVKP